MNGPYDPYCDVFIKVGGSILDHASHTAALAATLSAISGSQRLLILPGGGRVAKRIKANQRDGASDFQRCWKATTLALDVNAGLLASHSTRFAVVTCVSEILAAQKSGCIPVFAPAEALFGSLWFAPNWTVTTDTMGLYFAHQMGAQRYVIVTDVDGVCERRPDPDVCQAPLPCIRVADLERLPCSKLDAAFPAFFRRYPLETVVVNGKHPARVSAAIAGRRALGTEIIRDVEADSATARELDGRRQERLTDCLRAQVLA